MPDDPNPNQTQDPQQEPPTSPGQYQSVSQPAPDLPLEQPQQPTDVYDTLKQSLTQKWMQNQPVAASGGPVRQLLQNFIGTGGRFLLGDHRQKNQELALNDLMKVQSAQSQEDYRKALASQYEMVDVPLPDGSTAQLPRKFMGQWMAAQFNAQSRKEVATINADSKESIAATNADSKETAAGPPVDIPLEAQNRFGLPAKLPLALATKAMGMMTGEENAQSRRVIANAVAQRTNIASKTFERDTFGTIFGNSIPSSLVDESGNTLGWKSPAMPTSNIKTQAQQSGDLSKLFKNVQSKIAQADAAGLIGPGAGRINEIMTGKVGADNPQFAELRALGSLTASGMLKAHFGARGGSEMYKHFEDLFNTGKMTAGDLEGALKGFSTFMDQYASRAKTVSDSNPAGVTMRVTSPFRTSAGKQYNVGDTITVPATMLPRLKGHVTNAR